MNYSMERRQRGQIAALEKHVDKLAKQAAKDTLLIFRLADQRCELYQALKRAKREMSALYSMSTHSTEQKNEYVATIRAIEDVMKQYDEEEEKES